MKLPSSQEAVVERIEMSEAIIRLGSQELSWPVDHLPAGVKPGDRVRVSVLTPEQDTADRQQLAKEILNEVLHSEEPSTE